MKKPAKLLHMMVQPCRQLVCIHDNAVRESIRIMVLSGGNVAMQLCAACAADTLMQISLHRVQGHCEGMALA